jgi:hypothetical protein
MRWFKKREIVIYYLLYKKFKDRQFNLGEALDILSPYFSKKVSLNVIRYLTNVGVLIKVGDMNYKVLPFEEYLGEISFQYLRRRAILRRKTQ